MLSSLFQSSTIPVLEQVVNFTEARHGVLAGNIANMDTPGYKSRDLSPAMFQERLKEAISAQHEPIKTESEYFDPETEYFQQKQVDTSFNKLNKVAETSKAILRHDGGEVSMEDQVNEIVKNQQQHNLAISIMTSQFRTLRAAITERVA